MTLSDPVNTAACKSFPAQPCGAFSCIDGMCALRRFNITALVPAIFSCEHPGLHTFLPENHTLREFV